MVNLVSAGLFPKTEEWLLHLKDISQKYSVCARELPANEKDWHEGQVMRETLMAELDGVDMSDEEIQAAVDIQLPTNPHRMKFNHLRQKLYKEVL